MLTKLQARRQTKTASVGSSSKAIFQDVLETKKTVVPPIDCPADSDGWDVDLKIPGMMDKCNMTSFDSHPKKIQPSSHFRVDLLSHESKTTDKPEQYDWRAEKIWTGCASFYHCDSLALRQRHSNEDEQEKVFLTAQKEEEEDKLFSVMKTVARPVVGFLFREKKN